MFSSSVQDKKNKLCHPLPLYHCLCNFLLPEHESFSYIQNDLNHLSNKELLALACNDDKAALSHLCERLYAPAKAFFRVQRIPKEVQEHLVQETLMRFTVMHKNIRDTDRIDSYLTGIMIRCLRSHFRNKEASLFETLDLENIDENPNVAIRDERIVHFESEDEQKDLRTQIERAMEFLPPKYREVFRLHYLENLEYEVIAIKLNISLDAAKKIGARAKNIFKKNY